MWLEQKLAYEVPSSVANVFNLFLCLLHSIAVHAHSHKESRRISDEI